MSKQWAVLVDKEQRIYRNAKSPDGLRDYAVRPDIQTLYAILEYSASEFADRDALGYRDVLDVIVEEKDIKKVVNGEE
ncbi:hypothetical protein EV182_003127, partial [Spiromyces aspiralis]